MGTRSNQVPVSVRALTQRINRVLAKQNEVLKWTRGWRAKADLGDWYVLDVRHNRVSYKNDHMSLEALGRKLGALRSFERLDGGTP